MWNKIYYVKEIGIVLTQMLTIVPMCIIPHLFKLLQ